MTENTNETRKKSNIPIIILVIICIAVIAAALVKILPALNEYRRADQTYTDLSGQMVAQQEESAEEEIPWWAQVEIDFDELKAINPDVVGWIRFDDPEKLRVDYPILYSTDNATYLHKDLYGKKLTAGSIFLEAQNSPDFTDYYTIIYGHNMKNGSMFGTLKQYRRDETLYDSGNDYFTIYTEDRACRYQIFAYGETADQGIIYTVGYQPDEEYQKLIDTILSHSMKDTGIVPTVNDRIVTLSTCTSSGEKRRFVVHGVLVDQR